MTSQTYGDSCPDCIAEPAVPCPAHRTEGEASSQACRCGHPVGVHEAGECWWDTVANAETWDDRNQCQCDWYEPAGVTP